MSRWSTTERRNFLLGVFKKHSSPQGRLNKLGINRSTSNYCLWFFGMAVLFMLPNHNIETARVYRNFPHFWTSIGFCPAGLNSNGDNATNLLSDAVKMNMRQISALPSGAVTHVRVHWLLELLEFMYYTQAGVPIYDFSYLDDFIQFLDELDLAPVVEFMANPGDVFTENPQRNEFLWENLAYQVIKRYQNKLGVAKIAKWRFETWNEPDLFNYNRLNFTVEDYLQYVQAVRTGMSKTARNSLLLAGPAGLFKSPEKHPLCWHMLEYCSTKPNMCPINLISFHRKGQGLAEEVLAGTLELLQQIYEKYPELVKIPIVNSEADPIATWSQPRAFQADVRYAAILLKIVLQHWRAKAEGGLLKHLQWLSHDNAFLSYHPFEFEQRTLLAHFRMNNTHPSYSQFIQKPVYAALGFLSKMGMLAAVTTRLPIGYNNSMQILKTVSKVGNVAAYCAILFVSSEHLPKSRSDNTYWYRRKYRISFPVEIPWAYLVERLESNVTDPAYIWRQNQKPAYPDFKLRAAMRRSQTPIVHKSGRIGKSDPLVVDFCNITPPWALLVRGCSTAWPKLQAPIHLIATPVTKGEVFLNWREHFNSTQCLHTYEVWFRARVSRVWMYVSESWHLPFPSFHFAPTDQIVSGFYKVRGIDLFNETGLYSSDVEYFEV